MDNDPKNNAYKWYILVLAALTNTVVVALPSMSMAVLFKEISVNLNLDLVQVGLVRDGFMAVFITMIIETEGVGPVFAGTATGFVLVFSGVGNLIAPPIGNSLAVISPSTPFIFWACLAAAGLIWILLTKESRLPVETSLVAQPSD